MSNLIKSLYEQDFYIPSTIIKRKSVMTNKEILDWYNALLGCSPLLRTVVYKDLADWIQSNKKELEVGSK